MAITRTVTQVYNGPSAAGQILAPTINVGLGVPAAMAGTFSDAGIFGGDTTSNVTAYNGYRVAQAMNLSGNRYVSFSASHNGMQRQNLDTLTNGGMRIVFEDNSGNWSAFNVYGGDIGPFVGGIEGGWQSFLGYGASNDFGGLTPAWILERSRTPVASSGTLDWANIAAYEIHFRPASSMRCFVSLGRFATVDLPVHTGTVINAQGVFFDIRQSYGAPGGSLWPFFWASRVPTGLLEALTPRLASTIFGAQFGNGSTTTTLNLSNNQILFWPTAEDDAANLEVPNSTIVVQSPRLIDVFQGASDNVTFNDCVFSSTRLWGFRLRGTPGTFSAARTQWIRYAQMETAHGTYTDCIWDGGTVPVSMTNATTITRGTIRNAAAGGVTITSGPGNYSTRVNASFSNNASYDIAMGSGGAGTYVLSGVSVIGAYTLKIRNDSPTNAITVEIPGGITFSTSTAGGSITVTTPAIYQSVTVNGLVSGSRLQIFDTTNNVELANVITGTSHTWTDPNPATGNRNIRVRIAYVSGTTAKQFIEAAIGTAGTGSSNAAVTYLANQVDDPVYIANGIDGSTVTGITITDSIDRMIINIGGGSVSWPQIYAYNVWWLHTAAGIIDDGAIITAVDTANYRVTGFKIRNSSTVPLSITGGYGVDTATGSVASLIDQAGSTGNIYQTPDVVIAYATGSGLSPAESAKLMSLNTDAVNLVAIRGQTITGTGSEADPWGP